MRKNFRTYDLAVEFYKLCEELTLKRHLRDQLDRAASSVALNLAEGSGRSSKKEQKRFFDIAMASLRESQAVLDLAVPEDSQVAKCADKLAAHLYNLIQAVTKTL